METTVDPIDRWIDEIEREHEYFRQERIRATKRFVYVAVAGAAVLAVTWMTT
jgi:hypothetical protein